MRTQEQIDIDAPSDVVWEVISDVRGWPGWTASVTAVVPLQDGPLQVGARYRVRQPRLPQAVWEVTEVLPGRSFTWVNRSPGLTSTGVHSVEPTGARASTGTLLLEQVGVLSVVARAFGGLTRRYVAMEAAGLKRRSEEASS